MHNNVPQVDIIPMSKEEENQVKKVSDEDEICVRSGMFDIDTLYMLVEKESGNAVYYRPERTLKFKQNIFSAIDSVEKGKANLFIFWRAYTKEYKSNVSLVDNINFLKREIVNEIEYLKKKREAYGDFLETYQVKEEDEYILESRILNLLNKYTDYDENSIEKIMEAYKVPWKFKHWNPVSNKSRYSDSDKYYLLSEAIKALKTEFHKWDDWDYLYG